MAYLGGKQLGPHVLDCLKVIDEVASYQSVRFPESLQEQSLFYIFATRIETLGLPDYDKKIKEPMDFGRLVSALVEEEISVQDFWRKAGLIFSNCRAYWRSGNREYCEKADELERVFDREMAKVFPHEKKPSRPGAITVSVGGGAAAKKLNRQTSFKIKASVADKSSLVSEAAGSSPSTTSHTSKDEEPSSLPKVGANKSFIIKVPSVSISREPSISKEGSLLIPGPLSGAKAATPKLPRLLSNESFTKIPSPTPSHGEEDASQRAPKPPQFKLIVSSTGGGSATDASSEAQSDGSKRGPPLGVFHKRAEHTKGEPMKLVVKSESLSRQSSIAGDMDRSGSKRKASEMDAKSAGSEGGGKKAKISLSGDEASKHHGGGREPHMGSFSKSLSRGHSQESVMSEDDGAEPWVPPEVPAESSAPKLKKRGSKILKSVDLNKLLVVHDHDESWVKKCKEFSKKLLKHPFIMHNTRLGDDYRTIDYGFHKPVLDVWPELKDAYLKVIKRPMSFTELIHNLVYGEYKNTKEFLNDTRLIFQNAYEFNQGAQDNFQKELCAVSTYMEEQYLEMLALETLELSEEYEDRHYNLSEQRRDELRQQRYDVVTDYRIDKGGGYSLFHTKTKTWLKSVKSSRNNIITLHFKDPVPTEGNEHYFDAMKGRTLVCFSDMDKKLDGFASYTVGDMLADLRTIIENAVFFNKGKVDRYSQEVSRY